MIADDDNHIDKECLTQLFKASADALRLDVLRVLQNNSFNVQELCQILSIKQSGLSHHLKILANALLVTTRREGNSFFYRRSIWSHDHKLANLQRAIFHSIDQYQLDAEIQQHIAAVEQQRTESSNRFFIENADKFRQQQDLIASFEQYAEAVSEFLIAIPTPSKGHVIEVGPGEGLFLPYLARHFKHITAVDTSAEMLNRCQALVEEQKLKQVALIHGDTSLAVRQELQADALIMNMVLHHVAAPAELFSDAYTLLKPGGALLVTELGLHDQEWAQKACGDVWLGFDPEELSYWARKAGLFEGESSFLAQRNGFTIQIRHFYKPEEF